jgi:ABC transporter substrate binding protein
LGTSPAQLPGCYRGADGAGEELGGGEVTAGIEFACGTTACVEEAEGAAVEARGAVVTTNGAQIKPYANTPLPTTKPKIDAPSITSFRAIAQDRCDALVVFPDSVMYEISDHVARLALQAKLPSVSGWSSFANKGLLMTYGPNVRALYRSLAGYVDQILRGMRPADLPFQAPTSFYLAINVTTAKALGLAVPPSLLARADEVIE